METKKGKIFGIALWVAIIGLISVIFVFSGMVGAVSNEFSEPITDKVNSVVTSRIVTDLDQRPAIDRFILKEKISIAVRKTAHITEFFLLGALFLLRFRLYGAGNMRAALYSVSACLFLAVFDEYHQTFIPGRYGCLEDVLVDFFGVVSGILLCAAVIALVLRIKNKKTKKELSSV